MMDDSLSDTQQEKQMSVKELKLTDTLGTELIVKFADNELTIEFNEPDTNSAYLDRLQAYSLMLYLQEYLK